MNWKRAAGVLAVLLCVHGAAVAQDLNRGVSTSMFGTYVHRGEWIVYPFVEYYRDHNFEYAPQDLGHVGDQDFRGRYRATEALVFMSYGVTDDLAIELEAARIRATLDKSPSDHSSLPSRLVESGLGDVEGQVRWRWKRETAELPEVFSYVGAVLPHDKQKRLIGTDGSELNIGTGVTRGFRWGTMTARAALEYAQSSTSRLDTGEVALEYWRQITPKWRVFTALEGAPDELSLIAEVQWELRHGIVLKLNHGLGLTSKATDHAPEIGILFSIPTR